MLQQSTFFIKIFSGRRRKKNFYGMDTFGTFGTRIGQSKRLHPSSKYPGLSIDCHNMIDLSDKLKRPPMQAVAVLAIALVLMFLGWAFTASGIITFEPLFAWSIGAAFMLFFAMMNSLLSIKAVSFTKYWGASMYSFMALAFCTSMSAWLFSGIPLKEAGSYRWIYIVVTIGFIVFLSLVNTVKIIVRFAEKEEWNQPRKR